MRLWCNRMGGEAAHIICFSARLVSRLPRRLGHWDFSVLLPRPLISLGRKQSVHSAATLHWTSISILLVERNAGHGQTKRRARVDIDDGSLFSCSQSGRQADRARFEAISGWVEGSKVHHTFQWGCAAPWTAASDTRTTGRSPRIPARCLQTQKNTKWDNEHTIL
jgi:hypothetical protein